MNVFMIAILILSADGGGHWRGCRASQATH